VNHLSDIFRPFLIISSDIFRPFLIISGTNTLDYDFNFLPLAFLGGVLQCKEEKEK